MKANNYTKKIERLILKRAIVNDRLIIKKKQSNIDSLIIILF